ncbi:MAG: glutamate 5-kinase [Alphaproteobacteria bacterium]
MNCAEIIRQSELIVIKVGSVLVTDESAGKARQSWIESLAQDVKDWQAQGKKVVIVSSGAIALGRGALGISKSTPPSKIPLEQKQAASAVGQFHLFAAYFQAFSALGLQAAQVLLTMSETENRRMHLNARATLLTLLDKNIVPIINENDTISTGEIRFGDNDRLSVRVAQMIEADLVILLSTTDGLYTADPTKNKNAKHIPLIESIGPEHIKMAGDAVPGLSTGGMKSKIEAAASATRAGIALLIANGAENHPLKRVTGDIRASIFLAQESKSSARKRWLQAHLSPKGSVFVDDGALKALKSGKSLLPVGVKKTEGDYVRGDAVHIRTMEGKILGMGLIAYSTDEARRIIGKASDKIPAILGYEGREELIHRNDMALQD